MKTLFLFLAAFAIFWASPARHLGDNQYALLLGENLLVEHDFALERYFQKEVWAAPHTPWFQLPWQLLRAGGHINYRYPPGTSLLSLPLIALCRCFGWSCILMDGTYDFEAEIQLQGFLASILMALMTVCAYRTSRLLLDWKSSLVLTVAFSLGTSVWSVASRGLWSHTWELLILGWTVYELLAHELAQRPPHAMMLGFLGALLYIVRPTGALPLLFIGVYILAKSRAGALRYAAGAAPVLAWFFADSYARYGRMLPIYYRRGNELDLRGIPEALAGTLISPSRGLLVFTPVLLYLGFLLARHARRLPHPALAALAGLSALAQQAILCAWPCWWGGQTYGARLSSCMLPWLFLLGVLALRAQFLSRPGRLPAQGLALGLMVASVILNAPGALSKSVQAWNGSPFNIDSRPDRLWDWRHPQPLAVFGWPLPWSYLPFPGRLQMGSEQAAPYLWGGWDEPDGPKRWTGWKEASLIFSWPVPSAPVVCRIQLEPYFSGGAAPEQRLLVFLNYKPLGTWTLRAPGAQQLSIRIPPDLLNPERNRLTFQLPDAVPVLQGRNLSEKRWKGVGVYWICLRSLPPVQPRH